MKKQPEGKSLADYALEVLEEEGMPLHSKDLTEKMIAKGWRPVGSKPAHVVYTTLFGQVGRHGDICPFRFLGKGIFATLEQVQESKLEALPVKTSIQTGSRSLGIKGTV